MSDMHTPTPWYTDDPHIVAASVGDDIVYLANTNDLDTDYETSVANAAHIVHTVNCHDELLSAARTVMDGLLARIDAAVEAGEPVPVFVGIAELHDAIEKATRP